MKINTHLPKRRQSKAFTLIEMIGVLAVIAILAALLIPKIFNAINSAQYSFNATTRIFTPNATFLAPTSTFDPRILQLAAKVTF